MKHGCNQMKIFQRDYFGMKRIFTKRTGHFLLGRVDNVAIGICYTDKYSNLFRHESVHHRGHGGHRDLVFSDETRMIAERRLKNSSSLFYRYFPLQEFAFICVSIKI